MPAAFFWEDLSAFNAAGLSTITKEGEDAVRSALKELEWRGYLERQRRRDELGMLREMEFTIYEQPQGISLAAFFYYGGNE